MRRRLRMLLVCLEVDMRSEVLELAFEDVIVHLKALVQLEGAVLVVRGNPERKEVDLASVL